MKQYWQICITRFWKGCYALLLWWHLNPAIGHWEIRLNGRTFCATRSYNTKLLSHCSFFIHKTITIWCLGMIILHFTKSCKCSYPPPSHPRGKEDIWIRTNKINNNDIFNIGLARAIRTKNVKIWQFSTPRRKLLLK